MTFWGVGFPEAVPSKSLFGLFFRLSFYSDNKYSAQGQSAFVWGNVGFVGPLGPRTDSGGRIVFSVFSALPLVSGRTKTGRKLHCKESVVPKQIQLMFDSTALQS